MFTMNGLVLSLPARNSTIRMRVWRALKETGCGVLRDGVYVLPAGSAGTATLAAMEAEIKAGGGFAMTVELQLKSAEQLAHVRGLFDRSADYGALVRKIDAVKASLARIGVRKAQTAVRRLERSFARLSQIDFFPAQAKLQAADAILALQKGFQTTYARGEPRPSRKRLRQVDPLRYQRRIWATRKNPWVDRLASAWLIKRFIDRAARFVWLDRPRDRPTKAIGFDFDGADFTHVGNRVTFEVLLQSFGLDSDPALCQLAATVHFLDVGGIPVADAKGLEMVLKGARDSARSDDELALAAAGVFDHLYSAYRSSAANG